jgi:hypothetical protein
MFALLTGGKMMLAGSVGSGVTFKAGALPKTILIFGGDSFLTVVSGGAGRVTSEVGIARLRRL